LKKVSSNLMRQMKSELQECSKEHTLRVTFSPEKKPYFRNEVLEAICKMGIASHEIVAAGPMNDNSRWLVTLIDKDSTVTLMSNPPSIRGSVARVTTMESNIVNVRVHWLPMHIPSCALVAFLSQYGVVHNIVWDKSSIKGFEQVNTLIRNIVIELDEDVEMPSLCKLVFEKKTYKMLVTIPGRGPVCFRCNAVGHTRSECTSVFCRHCNIWGHDSESCAAQNSFASKLKQPEDRVVSHVSGEEDDEVEEALYAVAAQESQNRRVERLSESDSDGSSTNSIHITKKRKSRKTKK
jgi:hypothetical protein